MGMKGYDSFFPDPGTVDKIECKVCGAVCKITRNVDGATGYAESVSGGTHLHDYFTCPYSDEDWHSQALEIAIEITRCPSPTLRLMMQDDIDHIVKIRETWYYEK